MSKKICVLICIRNVKTWRHFTCFTYYGNIQDQIIVKNGGHFASIWIKARTLCQLNNNCNALCICHWGFFGQCYKQIENVIFTAKSRLSEHANRYVNKQRLRLSFLSNIHCRWFNKHVSQQPRGLCHTSMISKIEYMIGKINTIHLKRNNQKNNSYIPTDYLPWDRN